MTTSDTTQGAPPAPPATHRTAPFRESTPDDGPAVLRARLREDGYLCLRGCVSAGRVRAVRTEILAVLHRLGWTGPDGLGTPAPGVRLFPADPDYWTGVREVLRLHAFYAARRDPGLQDVLTGLFGEPHVAHPRTVPRIAFPADGDRGFESPSHQDHPYGQGGPDTLTVWMPFGDVSREQGSLEILRGSHRGGLRPVFGGTVDRCAATRVDQWSPQWRGGDLRAGDVLVFTSLTVHRARPNRSPLLRLSQDSRHQPVTSPLCASALEPAFRPKVPDWPDLLPDAGAGERDLPPGMRVVPAVPPERATAPPDAGACAWLRPGPHPTDPTDHEERR